MKYLVIDFNFLSQLITIENIGKIERYIHMGVVFLIYQVTRDLINYLHFFSKNYLSICTNFLSTTFILKQQLLTMSRTLPPHGSC